MDTQQVKNLISIKTDKHDDYLNTIVPLIEEFAGEYCNQALDTDNLPSGVKIFVAKAAEYLMNPTGVSSRSAPGTNYQYNMDFPPSILKLLRPYRKLKVI